MILYKAAGFTVPGQPKAKARPRFTRTGHAYTDKATKEYEALVRKCFDTQIGYKYTGAIHITITAYREIPKSGKSGGNKLRENDYCLCKPDLDNIVKIILDALNGYAYDDDNHIVEIKADKKWSKDPGVFVYIEERDF